MHSANFSQDGADWGAFGEFMGGFSGSLISVVTLIALAYNIRLQAADLAATRAYARSQAATMSQQAFDSVFFNLLERFSEVRDSVEQERSELVTDRAQPTSRFVTVSGRAAFNELCQSLVSALRATPDPNNRLLFIQTTFDTIYRLSESELGPYFRTLYHIFKYIHNSSLTPQQKIDYANIARSQLSDVELCVLFYDGLTDKADHFKPLIEEYGILKHINPARLAIEDDKRNVALYHPNAFRSQEERVPR
jgi:hypothetical protein